MNFQRFESQIMRDEGFRARPYLDTVGVPTIGYGTTRILGVPVTMDMPAISADSARQMLRSDLYGALIDAQALFVRFSEMGDVRQEVLANMAYNLGRRGLAGFGRLRKAAEKLDYEQMAAEMQDSRWYRQVGFRSARLVQQMRTGEA